MLHDQLHGGLRIGLTVALAPRRYSGLYAGLPFCSQVDDSALPHGISMPGTAGRDAKGEIDRQEALAGPWTAVQHDKAPFRQEPLNQHLRGLQALQIVDIDQAKGS